MALKIPKIGLSQMLKDGYSVQQGLEEAVYRNIEACRSLAHIVRTSYGPNGKNKMVINHLDKLFVTNDAATIIRELEVIHPAAKMLVMASQQQEQEYGDGTNLVIVLAGELLNQAEFLLRMGLHPSEVIEGYDLASKKALEILDKELKFKSVGDLRNKDDLLPAVRSALSSKQQGYEDLLAPLVIEACLDVMPENINKAKQPDALFNVDSVRIVKILGGSINDSRVVRGMVFGREPEGTVQKVTKAKIAVFTCPLDIQSTETKGTVLIKSAQEMLNFSKGEEEALGKQFQELADAGVKVAVTGSSLGDLALHFLNRFNIMVVKVPSKFDLRRLCKVVGATPLARLGRPLEEEMGFVDVVETVEIGSDRCTVFRQEAESSRTGTIVLRGATQNLLDDVERSIDDAVHTIKALARDRRMVPGAGAVEVELAKRLANYGDKIPGLSQYCIKKYAEALEIVPRLLAENAGLDGVEVLSKLYAGHSVADGDSGQDVGVNVESTDPNDVTLHAFNSTPLIVDPLAVKMSAIRLVTHAVMTVLSVDQIIMSKPAGGPKLPTSKGMQEAMDADMDD